MPGKRSRRDNQLRFVDLVRNEVNGDGLRETIGGLDAQDLATQFKAIFDIVSQLAVHGLGLEERFGSENGEFIWTPGPELMTSYDPESAEGSMLSVAHQAAKIWHLADAIYFALIGIEVSLNSYEEAILN